MGLRDMTGAGMMDCKKALAEADGDFDKAVEILRKKGQKVADKRADREAKEGLVVTKISDDAKKAAAIEINCETDFVAGNDDFQAQAEKFLNTVYENDIEDLDTLMATEVEGVTVADHLQQMTGTIGEKIQISKVVLAKTDG